MFSHVAAGLGVHEKLAEGDPEHWQEVMQVNVMGALRTIREGIKGTSGMILTSGPTGSGKSTSLYALLQEVKSEAINIVTLEDPVEYKMPGVNQIQVNADVGLTFGTGLRSILRQDPDVVMVGEIRDKETAELAVQVNIFVGSVDSELTVLRDAVLVDL